MSKADDMRIMYHKKNFEVYFGEGIPDRQEERRNKLIYPEELLDKKCGGCVRCKVRDHAYYDTKAEGYHCMKLPYDRDISPDDKACVDYWDKAEYERLNKLHEQDIENRRKELWAIYEKRDPIKLPMPIEEPDNVWVRNLKQLNKLDKEWQEYKEQGHCEWTDCEECNYQNICDEWWD